MSDRPETIDSETLFVQHAQFVARFLVRLGVSSHDLDDVVQEVFLVVHRHGGYRRGPAKPTTWLAAICLRASSSYRRKKARHARESADTVNTLPGQEDPDRKLQTQEHLEIVQRALDKLDPDRRAVFVLYELEGEPCDAIAAGLGVPVGTVYSRLHTARKRFRKSVERELASERPLKLSTATPGETQI